jgi:hypothetical protein
MQQHFFICGEMDNNDHRLQEARFTKPLNGGEQHGLPQQHANLEVKWLIRWSRYFVC